MIVVLRMLAYGVTVDFMDEYVRIWENIAMISLKKFVAAVFDIFLEEYLRLPNNEDIARLLTNGQSHGFLGMLESIKYWLYALEMEKLFSCMEKDVLWSYSWANYCFGSNDFIWSLNMTLIFWVTWVK